MNALTEKFKEIAVGVLPIVGMVLLLHFFVTPLEGVILARFLFGAALIMIGMPLFLLGVDLSISPIGEDMSHALIQTNKMKIVVTGSFLFGFIISVAEPDLHILAKQVSVVTNNIIPQMLLVVVVSLGIGLLIALGMYRILKRIPLNRFMIVIYAIIFVLAIFSNSEFLAIAFDASGSTTGSVTVPFMLAMAAGASAITRSGKEDDSDSFGLLGIASSGAIIGVLLMGIIGGNNELAGGLPVDEAASGSVLGAFLEMIPETARESFLSLIPVLVLFLIVNAISLKKGKRAMQRITIGLFYTVVGLILFLTGVNAGFMDASRRLGFLLAENHPAFLVILIGAIFGVLTIPAEPSVHILNKQIERETSGAIKSRTVMFSLCIGVGIAVGLSILRIMVPALQLWHILLPGMIIAIVLSFLVPELFVGIAFDSGGVAAGTMTATFILPYTQGIAESYPLASVLTDGFGVIALVAITPIITVQLLGWIYRLRTKHDTKRTEGEIYE